MDKAHVRARFPFREVGETAAVAVTSGICHSMLKDLHLKPEGK